MQGILRRFALGAGIAAMLAALVSSETLAKEGVEARLDRPIPKDAAAGSTITLGWSLWFRDEASGEWRPFTGNGGFVRLYGVEGSSTEASGTEDWTGHFLAEVAVPAGGIGRVEIGLAGTACRAGTCWRSDEIFPVTGIGPRDGVPIAEIYRAKIDPLPVQISARRPVRVGIWFVPKPGVDADAVPLPASVFVEVTDMETDGATHVAARPEGRVGHFAAMVTFPESGHYRLAAAVGDDNRIEDVFGESIVRLQVPTMTKAPTPWPPAAASDPATATAPPASSPSVAVFVGLVATILVAFALAAIRGRQMRADG
jgi:hypothetical protein